MTNLKWMSKLLLILCATAIVSFAFDTDVVHAVSGAVTKIDKDAKTIAVKTADGTEHVFHYTEKSTIRGAHDATKAAKAGAVDTYFAGKEGTHVVVRYTEKGADKTASSVDDFGKASMKMSEGTVTRVDKAAHTVSIKTEDGAETTYDWGKDATIDTEHGVVKSSQYVAKEGDKVVVHYTEDAGKKVVHFFKGM
jgi:NADH dehydrogenase FAD-containing subunit